MAKIDQIQVGVTNGQDAADKINEAMKTVETDTSITGDGTTANPLKVNIVQTIPLSWLKIASIVNTDPLDGNIAFNNADLSLCTEIYISNNSHQPINVAQMLSDSEGSGILIIQKNDDSKFIIFLVDTVTDNTTYHTFSISEYDSGALFDDGAELITTYVASVSSGGGHVIRDKDDVNYNQEPVLKYRGKVVAGTEETELVPRYDNSEDVDITGIQDTDLTRWDATQEKHVPQSIAPNVNIAQSSEVVNANGLLSTDLQHGYSFFKIVAKNSSGSGVTISIGSTNGGTDIVNAATATANKDTSLLLATDFFDLDNDTPLYVTSSDVTGVITLYFTPIKLS